MRINAQILSTNNNSGVSKKTGREYSINEVFMLDVEAPRPEVLKATVSDEDMNVVRSLVGKTVVCHVHMNSGNLRFGGQVVQSQPKVVNS